MTKITEEVRQATAKIRAEFPFLTDGERCRLTAIIADTVAATESRGDRAFMQFETKEAIHRVGANANPEWIAAQLEAVRICATNNQIIDSFKVQEQFLALYPNGNAPKVHEPRAMGAVMVKAAKEGWIKASNEARTATPPTSHTTSVKIWLSLIYKAE